LRASRSVSSAKSTRGRRTAGRSRPVTVHAGLDQGAAALLHTNVHQELRRRFITGKIVPGSTLSTRGIAHELGVSQTPVREALSRLAAEGAVQIRSKRKIVVPPMTADRFTDLLRCRELLELEAALAALPYIDKARLKRLCAVDNSIETALRTGDVNAYMEGNFNFHFLVYAAQPRRTLLQLIETLWLQFGPYMRVVYGRVGTADLIDQHEVMIKAIRRRDAAALGRALMADIRDGMGLIGQSGFAEPVTQGRNLGSR
jgi:DNA-binding GntR family transcriptional regulator